MFRLHSSLWSVLMKPSLTKSMITRLAVAGWLTVMAVLFLAIAPPVFADSQLHSAPIIYKDALPALQQSGIPLRLPTVLTYPGAHGAYGATLEYADGRGYSLAIGTRYPCHGTACTEASVEASPVDNLPSVEQMFAPMPVNPEADSPLDPTRSTETASWVTLANGQLAYFEPWISYALPGFAHLTWDEGRYRYSIGIKFGFREALVQMANTTFGTR